MFLKRTSKKNSFKENLFVIRCIFDLVNIPSLISHLAMIKDCIHFTQEADTGGENPK